MASPPKPSPLSTVAEDTSDTVLGDYCAGYGRNGSLTSSRGHARILSDSDYDAQDAAAVVHNQTSTSTLDAVNGPDPAHTRSVSDDPSRTPRATDQKHRPVYSLDSPKPDAPKRGTSWYLEDNQEYLQPSHFQSPNVIPPTPIPAQGPLEDAEGAHYIHPDLRGRPSQSSGLFPRPRLDRSATSYHTAHNSVSELDSTTDSPPRKILSRPLTMSSRGVSPKPALGALGLRVDPHAGSQGQERKKSKSSGISGFFGWRRGSDNRPESPSTDFSDNRSISPHSPGFNPKHQAAAQYAQSNPHMSGEQAQYYGITDSYYGPPSPGPEGQNSTVQAAELMRELQDVSVELAASIRREMELEDEVERYKSEMPPPQTEQSQRMSDFYSDSGYSSMRLPAADSGYKIEKLEKLRRKAEQDNARLRLEMSNRAQEEMNSRRELETQVQSLEQQLQSRGQTAGDDDRVKGLEASLDEHKRKLLEERQFKQNFEDLLSGMRQEIEVHRNERDHLREVIVPQLQNQLGSVETLTAENVRLSQENQKLAGARRLQLDNPASPRFRSIAEEYEEEPGSPRTPNPANMSRSNSVARTKSVRHRQTSRDGIQIIEPTEDAEVQKEALTRTLRCLILRQEAMAKTHEKEMRKIRDERDSALSEQKRKANFYFEIQKQRHELNNLRRRADDAMESKWQCEKGLAGLKMDLDRAQQETTSLQTLLEGGDSLLSDRPASSDDGSPNEESLDVAHDQLREVYDEALTKVQSSADREHPDVNTAALLASSTTRMQALSTQVEVQLANNSSLQSRLQTTISRGMTEQSEAAQKIADLETALRAAEEEVATATNISEEAVAEHEEHVRTMRAANDEQARRGLSSAPAIIAGTSASTKATPTVTQNAGLGLGLVTSGFNAAPTSRPFTTRVPKLSSTTSGRGMGVAEATKTEDLERRVQALEKVARSADREMQGLLERMEKSKIEVGGLQGDRDEAIRRTRRLQREILEEKKRLRALTA